MSNGLRMARSLSCNRDMCRQSVLVCRRHTLSSGSFEEICNSLSLGVYSLLS
jgi:hypothetical protein